MSVNADTDTSAGPPGPLPDMLPEPMSPVRDRLEAENSELRRRLDEAEETIQAIRSGAVDAFVVEEDIGRRVYTLEGADKPYRLLIEEMQQGAATLQADGTIVYCNRRLAELLKVSQQRLAGSRFGDFVDGEDLDIYQSLLSQTQARWGEARLRRSDAVRVPSYLTFNALPRECGAAIGLLVTDLTAQKRHEQVAAAEQKAVGQKRILEMVATGGPLRESLASLMRLIEELEPGIRCNTLLVSEDGSCLRRGSGPNMPEEFHCAVDGASIFPPYVGTCSEVVHRGTVVISPDLTTETRYAAEWRNLMVACGVRAIRSNPVFGSDGRVLASIAIYFDRPRDTKPADPELIDMATHLAAIAIERDWAMRALAQSEQRLSSELAAAKQLQTVSMELLGESDIQNLYDKIVASAAAIMRSDSASMQMFHPERSERGELQLLASRGFTREAEKFWEWVRADSGSTCGEAMRTGRRAVASDVATCHFMAGTDDRTTYLQAGILAVQSTPLISRSGALLGMLSTHWRVPHEPSESDLRLFDVLARQAADLVERRIAGDALQERANQLKLLIDELNHRVKNTLATVQSIAAQTLGNAESSVAGQRALEARLVALANAHDVLTRGHWEGANIWEVVAGAMSAYKPDGAEDRVQIEGPEIWLLPKAALALAMALHELAINAVKYGALSNDAGRISISWSVTPGEPEAFDFRWSESGGPPVTAPLKRGFGSRLIERGLAHDLAGDIQMKFARSGLVCTINAPIEEIRSPRVSEMDSVAKQRVGI